MADCKDFWRIAELPFRDAKSGFASLPEGLAAQCLADKWGPRWDNLGFMHVTDHIAALRVVLEREPTWIEVDNSYRSQGSKNIDAAREKAGYDVAGRPAGWDGWNDEQKRYAALIRIHGLNKGSKIFDGKTTDPTPKRTAELLKVWSGIEVVEPPTPTDPPVTEKDPIDKRAEELADLFYNKPAALANAVNGGIKEFAAHVSSKPTRKLVFLFFKHWLLFYKDAIA